tara:strand:- start:4339 stop:4698 length:360 start_codon:yes stop_codon:yes gene_type:complete
VDDVSERAEIKLHLMLDDASGTSLSQVGEKLSVHLDEQALGVWRVMTETKYAGRGKTEPFTDKFLEYEVSPSFVAEGENQFVLKLSPPSATEIRLRDLQLWITYPRRRVLTDQRSLCAR